MLVNCTRFRRCFLALCPTPPLNNSIGNSFHWLCQIEKKTPVPSLIRRSPKRLRGEEKYINFTVLEARMYVIQCAWNVKKNLWQRPNGVESGTSGGALEPIKDKRVNRP